MTATISKSTMQSLASAARRGDNKALGDMLTALTLGGGFAEFAGTPVSNLTPDRKGEFCLDTTNGTWWRAKGLVNTDWVALGDPDISLAELTFLDGALAGTGVASKALVLDSSGNTVMPDGGFFSPSIDTLAAAGSNQGDAAVIADQRVIVTGADGAKGVALPAAADQLSVTVTNDSPIYAVKVYPVNAGNDIINVLASNDPFLLGPEQTCTFDAISATQWYAPKEASLPRQASHFEIYDDFLLGLDTTTQWIVFSGSEGAAIDATYTAAPEGTVKMDNAAAGNANGGSVLSLKTDGQGALVSLGDMVFETRVSLDALTAGFTVWIGLSDGICEVNEDLPHTISGDTVTDGDAFGGDDAVGFLFSTDATLNTSWLIVREKATSIQTPVEDTGVDPTAGTYDVLRIEVDADGETRWYVNGALVQTTAAAIATTATLVPFFGIDEGAGAQSARDLTIDYVRFSGVRPATN